MSRNSQEVIVHTGDGTAGSGKGTIGSYLETGGIPALDTGRGYRAVTEYWFRSQGNAIDRADREHIEDVLQMFVEDREQLEGFVDLLYEKVAFGVDGIWIEDQFLTGELADKVLYHDSINNAISLLARKKAVRAFCGQISLQFVQDAAEKDIGEVYLDGRSERKVVIDGLRRVVDLRKRARLGLPAYFEVDVIEAAHRTLSRDKGISYRTLSNDDPRVTERSESIKRRNQRDSDLEIHAEPMELTREHLVAWSDKPNLNTAALVAGRFRDGSGSRHVLFDTTGREKEETRSEYERWRQTMVEYLRSKTKSAVDFR